MLLAEQTEGLVTARDLLTDAHRVPGCSWGLDAIAGRFVEIVDTPGTAALTVVAGLILEVQQRGELVAWIGNSRSIFFPPDLAASGIDLEALPVITVNDTTAASCAADILLRSGSFTLLILDLRNSAEFSLTHQTRLVGLAKQHHIAILWIARRNHRISAGGSFASLRIETDKKRSGHDCFGYEVCALKDKRRTPGWKYVGVCRGTDGLC